MGIDFFQLTQVVFDSTAQPTQTIVQVFQWTEPISGMAEPVMIEPEALKGHTGMYYLLTAVWLMGSIAVFGLWLRRQIQFHRILRAGREVETGRVAEAFHRVRSWLLIDRSITLITLPDVVAPGVWGIWRPTVVLPEGLADDLSDMELEAVFMHELIHIARWDNLTSLLHLILCSLLWFHPIVWLIDRRLLAERERACDERVIDLSGEPRIYASSLLKTVRLGLRWRLAGVSCMTGSDLRRRIEHIMISHHPIKLSPTHRVLVGLTTSVVIALSLVAGALSHHEVNTQDDRSAILELSGQEAKGESESSDAPTDQPVKQERDRKSQGGVIGGVQGGVIGGVPGGVSQGIPGGVSGGVVGGIPGGVSRGVPGGVLGGVAGGVSGGVPQGVSGGVKGGVLKSGQRRPAHQPGLEEEIIRRLKQSPGAPISFENADDAPLVIEDARIKTVTREEFHLATGAALEWLEDPAYVTWYQVIMTNTTDRRIVSYGLFFSNSSKSLHGVLTGAKLDPSSQETLETELDQLSVWFPVRAGPVSVKVGQVKFEDGSGWRAPEFRQPASQ